MKKKGKAGKGTTTSADFKKLIGNIGSAGKAARKDLGKKSPYTKRRASGRKK